MSEPKRRRKHSPLWVLGAVVAVMLVIFIWLIATTGPTSFAGGEPVALTQLSTSTISVHSFQRPDIADASTLLRITY
jgi:hypothetical protein